MFNSPLTSTRRDALKAASCGFGYMALAGMVGKTLAAEQPATGVAASNPLAPRKPHFPAKAKRVIFLFMQGGPSHVDTYDYKPRLAVDDGKKVKFKVARTRKITAERVFKSPWKFSQYGDRGHHVSELLPHMAERIDDYCLLQGVHTDGVAHGPSTLALHTGATSLIRPSIGSWVVYGLGTPNDNLPGFVTISPSAKMGGPRNYGNAFLPSVFQGTKVGRAGGAGSELKIQHLVNQRLSPEAQRDQFELLRQVNQTQLAAAEDQRELEAAIASYELAFRMQMHAPDVLDITKETQATLDAYGVGNKATDEFGRQCLMARRLAEQGVRYIQVNYADLSNNPRWDQHSNLKKHEQHALATDQPVAALLDDLKQRGLLEDTILWWGGEFGRTPFAQGRDGRDHNPNGFTVWLAGGGVKPGHVHGATDEYGYHAVEGKMHMHDLHATILHLLGMNHERLTYRYAGRDFRLTDVHGRVVREIIA